jgi:hypothetical protein
MLLINLQFHTNATCCCCCCWTLFYQWVWRIGHEKLSTEEMVSRLPTQCNPLLIIILSISSLVHQIQDLLDLGYRALINPSGKLTTGGPWPVPPVARQVGEWKVGFLKHHENDMNALEWNNSKILKGMIDLEDIW